MRFRAGLVVAALGLAARLGAQNTAAPGPPPPIWQIDLVPSGTTFAATQPTLKNGVYTFQSWPEHAPTRLKQSRVRRVSIRNTKVDAPATVYQIDLIPSGQIVSRDQPKLKGNNWVFTSFRSKTIMSVRQTDVRGITPLSGEAAYWAQESAKGETPIGPLAMQGGSAITIASPSAGGSQAGAHSLSSINGAPAGNWSYQGTPGTSDAYGPANATVSNGVPTMPAATTGTAPPAQPH